MIKIAGIDEAGRGPLAGAVVAAAVILDPENPIEGLKDSKKLSAKRREILFDLIKTRALAYAVAEASVTEIAQLNILQATLLAMQRAVGALSTTPDEVWVDGNRCPVLPMKAIAIVGGDQTEPAISAASILAKVTRDRQMCALDIEHPEYGFAKHKGYGTAQHRAALKQWGATVHHRALFIRRIVS